MGSGANGYTMDDFNADNFDHTGLGFIGGGGISCGASGARPIQSRRFHRHADLGRAVESGDSQVLSTA